MLTLDRPQDALVQERGAARSVGVRVRPNGPVVDLPLGKTTVGASPRCNIRIQQPGVQPLHCLILNDANGLSVRRWAGETMLNGQRVEESAIVSGDCLQVGPVELEIVGPPAAAPVAAPSVAAPVFQQPLTAAPAPPAPLPSAPMPPATEAPATLKAPEPTQTDSKRYREGRELSRSRGRQLLAALREHRDSGRDLQQRVADLERDLERAANDRQEFAGQLQNLTSELAEARRQAAAQQHSATAHQEVASQNEHLGREVCSMIQRIEQLTNELTESSKALQTTVAEKESLAAESRRLADEQQQLREQLQRQTDRCSALSADCNNTRGQSESLRAELHAVTEREAAAAGKAEHFERELSALQQHSAELANNNRALCGERDEAWRQCESLRSNVHALSERESSLAQTVARLEHERSQQQLHREELVSHNAELCGERDEALRQCESLRSDAQSLKDREAALTENVNRLESVNSQHQSRVIDLSNQVAAVCGERDEALHQCESLRSDVQSLTDREVALTESVSRLKFVIGQHQSREAELSNQIAAACGERDEAWRQCDSLRSEVKSLTDREAALTESVSRLEHANGQHQSRETELSNRVAAVCDERDQAWRQCESMRSDVQSLNDREVALTESVSRLESVIGQHQSRETELSNRVAAVCDERDQAWRQCDSLRAEMQSLQEREATLSETVNRLERAIDQHQLQATEHSNQVAAIGSERDEARRKCENLRLEIQSLNEREATQLENVHRLEAEAAERVSESSQLTGHLGVLHAECGDLRDQNEQLRSQVNGFALERAAMTEEQAVATRERESLRGQLLETADRDAERAKELALLAAECQRYRAEADRLPQLEQQIRDAVADRENTSSELYRSLLQLAEMQERDDQSIALEAAYRAVNAELEKSTQDIAALQSQIDQLNENRVGADEARQSLDRRTAELIEAHQQLAYDKSTLSRELDGLRQQLEASREREAELVDCLEAADSSRRQLAETEQTLTELAETVARLQSEVEAKERVSASAAAEISDRDRQLGEFSQQLADAHEAVRLLERKTETSTEAEAQFAQEREAWRQRQEESERQFAEQLAEAREAVRLLERTTGTSTEAEAQFAQEREAWQRHREETERQESQLRERLAVLESQFVDARAAAEQAAQLVAEQAAQLAAAQASSATASRWNHHENDTDARFESTASQLAKREPEAESGIAADALDADAAPAFNWPSKSLESQPESDANPFGGTEHEAQVESAWDRSSDESPSRAVVDRDLGAGSDGWQSTGTQDEAGDWSCTAALGVPTPQVSDESWEHTDPSTSAMHDSPADESAVSPSKGRSASFIERYSHMFADDATSEVPQTTPAVPVASERKNETRTPSGAMPSAGGLSAAGDGEEESIEDYMAKLLQRVRGDSPAPTFTATTAPTKTMERVLPMTAPANFASAPLTAPPTNGSGDILSPMGFDPSKRRSSMPAPKTDLEALRALANESARRAISRHAIRKHRRTATTKVIVATLAGVSSLWLMLESEQWFNLQFITACVSMLVAAYWAAETFRTLLESLRVATSDETDEEIEELSAKLRSPLPIDVENARPWTSQQLNSPVEEPAAEGTPAE